MKTLLILAALAVSLSLSGLLAQEKSESFGAVSTSSLQALTTVHITAFQFYDDTGRVVLRITTKGEVEYGEGIKPTEGAAIFAKELRRLWPDVCVSSPAASYIGPRSGWIASASSKWDLGTSANAWACDDPRYLKALAEKPPTWSKAYCRDSSGVLHVKDSEETENSRPGPR